ncbi:oxidoreductase [Aureococcus anophagefferens]|nr:oxidoreductase [Aureococcus anophagefferens]
MSTSDLVAGAAVKAASPEAAEVVLKKEAAEAYPETKSLDLNPLHWWEAISYHWKAGNMNYPMGIYISLCHYWAVIGLFRDAVHAADAALGHSETDADPHNATRGFFFAHMGWLYVKKHPDIMVEGKKLDFSDLSRDGFVMFQKHLDPWFTLFMCFVFPALVAKFGWGENFWNAFWFNPTKLFIDGAAALGLVWNRKRATSAWERSR